MNNNNNDTNDNGHPNEANNGAGEENEANAAPAANAGGNNGPNPPAPPPYIQVLYTSQDRQGVSFVEIHRFANDEDAQNWTADWQSLKEMASACNGNERRWRRWLRRVDIFKRRWGNAHLPADIRTTYDETRAALGPHY